MSEQVNNLLTKSEYAKYKGVSKPMVSKWWKDGRLVMTADEKFVLVNESDARIKLTASLNGSFYDQKAKVERENINKIIEEKGLTELTAEVSYQQLDLETDDADVLFKNARALKEKASALQAAAEHAKFVGELVARDHVEKIVFERARQFRDGLLTCSRRIAPEISGKDDVKQIEDILYKEFRLLLDNFSKLPVVE
ncbi:MAG: hypothetical protein K2P74_04555 [Nitrosomonas sp.]|nr:hypothetical protein [Nitrosomonas sp.]